MDRDFREGCDGVRLTEPHFVRTSDAWGLTDEHVEEAIAKLSAQVDAAAAAADASAAAASSGPAS